MSSRAIWIPNLKNINILNSREEKHLSGAVGWACMQAAPSSEADWIRMMSSGGRSVKRSRLQILEEKSENKACNFLGFPIRALIEGKGTAALELIAELRRCLSSGVMNPGIFWSADGILSRTYSDIVRS